MALLAMLVKEKYNIVVCHVNYQLRPTSRLEEMLVTSFCRQHGIVLHISRPKRTKGNLEQWARISRYAFFARIYKQEKCDALLTAHQLDDHLETYLMSLERGSESWYYGIQSPVTINKMNVIRPLLAWRKAETRQYCIDNEISFHDDESNASDDYQRNRIRHQLVEPASDAQIEKWQQEINQANQIRQQHYDYFRQNFAQDKIEVARYRSADQRQLLLRWYLWQKFEGAVWSAALIQDIDHSIMTAARNFIVKLNDAGQFICEYGYFYACPYPADYQYVIAEPRTMNTAYFRLSRQGQTDQGLTLRKSDYPLTIRNWRLHDKIVMRYGTKTVSRFFIDHRISHDRRFNWPVVVNSHNEVIFVAQMGCDKKHFSARPAFYIVSKV